MVIPVSARERDFARGAVAHSQADQLLRSMRRLLEDARIRPVEGGYGVFVGDGRHPANVDLSKALPMSELNKKTAPDCLRNAMQGKWKGNYALPAKCDPWGNAFVITSLGDPSLYLWCVSAGANGILETTATDRWIRGDDMGMRIY